jgi:dTDP-glucose 4,6-dehydratase
LLHFSTDEVYGDIESGSHTEEDYLNPSNPYSSSKAAADLMIKSWNRTYGIEFIIVRPTNNYGKYQYPEKLIPLSVKLLDRGKKIRLHNKGQPTRNWLHVEDTSSAILKIIDSKVKNEVFNISGNFEQKNIDTVKQIIKSYNQDYNWREWVNLDFSRPGQDVRYSLEDKKIKNLGWKPVKLFKNEIDEIVKFYKNYFTW